MMPPTHQDICIASTLCHPDQLLCWAGLAPMPALSLPRQGRLTGRTEQALQHVRSQIAGCSQHSDGILLRVLSSML